MAKDQEVEETEDEVTLRSQMWKHDLFVEWLGEEYGVDLEQEGASSIIAWFAAKRNEFRKSDTYREAVDEHKAEQAEAKKAAAQERAAKKAERDAAKAAEGDGESKPKRSRKAKAEKEAAPAKKATRAKSKKSDDDEDGSDENPFD